MMECKECRSLVPICIDGELDPASTKLLTEHLDRCPDCKGIHDRTMALRNLIRTHATRFAVPTGLERRIRLALNSTPEESHSRSYKLWSWVNAGVSLCCVAFFAAGLILFRAVPSEVDRLTQEIATSHTRSLMANHLTDVASSDQHTVKPWFNGKLPFSPPVVDLADHDFALVGGRLDYLGERQVAALVYRRRNHIINLYVWPDQTQSHTTGRIAPQRGYKQVQWTGVGMSFWAASDLNLAEMEEFRNLIASRIDGNT